MSDDHQFITAETAAVFDQPVCFSQSDRNFVKAGDRSATRSAQGQRMAQAKGEPAATQKFSRLYRAPSMWHEVSLLELLQQRLISIQEASRSTVVRRSLGYL